MLNIGFLVSHGGTSMRAVLAAIAAGTLDARGVVVISNNEGAPALVAARAAGVPALHISATSSGGEAAADISIANALDEHDADLVVLSGYLRKLGPETLARYAGRILNIHPALLPKFGGRGMFGRHVHQAVLSAGDRVSGATIHVVDAEYDRGTIVAQETVSVLPGDGPDELRARVAAIEPELYVRTLRGIAGGTIVLPGGRFR